MLNKILVAFLLAGLTAVATAETVYKWVDRSGQIHYTDLPPKQPDAKILAVTHGINLFIDDEESEGGDGSDESGSDTTTPAVTPSEPPPSTETMASMRNDVERTQAEQCKQARERYQSYIEARRLFREVDGKRVYLTDQELTDARARAKQTVDEYCS